MSFQYRHLIFYAMTHLLALDESVALRQCLILTAQERAMSALGTELAHRSFHDASWRYSAPTAEKLLCDSARNWIANILEGGKRTYACIADVLGGGERPYAGIADYVQWGALRSAGSEALRPPESANGDGF